MTIWGMTWVLWPCWCDFWPFREIALCYELLLSSIWVGICYDFLKWTSGAWVWGQWAGSFCCNGQKFWRSLSERIVFSMSLSLPGKWTENLTLSLVRTMPWWELWSYASTSCLICADIIWQQPQRMRSSSNESIFQYHGHSVGRCCQCWGNPDVILDLSYVIVSDFVKFG